MCDMRLSHTDSSFSRLHNYLENELCTFLTRIYPEAVFSSLFVHDDCVLHSCVYNQDTCTLVVWSELCLKKAQEARTESV